MNKTVQNKKALRQELKEKRAALTTENRHTAALALSLHDLPFLSSSRKMVISFYMPIKDELDPRLLAKALGQKGHELCLPIVRADSKILKFHRYQFGDPLQKGLYDILEPSSEQPELFPDIVLLPLLAADRLGNRLGYGGGYYDQSLASLRKSGDVLAVGIAFDVQITDIIPVDAHDIRLDWVITESSLIAI